jgi:hypothetical protein
MKQVFQKTRLALWLFGLPIVLSAQNRTLSGIVRDASSGESLIGATVFSPTLNIGVTANTYGFYSLTGEERDSIAVVFNYLGFEPQVKKVFFRQNIRLDIALVPRGLELKEVEITAAPADKNVSRTQMGVIDVPLELVKKLPAILGETDALKIIQLLPGVQSGNEGTTGFHVRGGNTDQNLVQLDEATIYNPNHLFGLMSTFNTAALNNITLIKGGFPAQFGGRLSSILDITMKEGNNRRFKTEGGIGQVSSRLTVEGPLAKGKSSFVVSGRRTYLDLLLKPFLPKNIKTTYRFYDLNAKINYQLGKNDRLFLSFFNARDRLDYLQSGISYDVAFGNATGTLRWNHLFGQRLFSNTSLIFNRYKHSIEALQNNVRSHVLSGIEDAALKTEFQYFPTSSHQIHFGGVAVRHRLRSEGDARFQPGTPSSPDFPVKKTPSKTFHELAFYANDDIRFSPRFSASVGLRVPVYIADSANFVNAEPRLALKFGLNERTSLKAAFTSMNQYLHLIPGSAASIPYDIWAPSTRLTKPQGSRQYSLGLFKNFRENAFETSIEFYYKTMQNQVLFREGNQLAFSLDLDPLLVYGKGWSYGAEFFVQKNRGKLTGWISYTLSRTDQKFEELNFGKIFPFRYDKRHNLNIAASYALSKRWALSSVFVFTSGAAFTVPTGRVAAQQGGSLFEGNYFIYEARNNVRLAPYHRLDVSAIYKKQRKFFGKKYDSEWVFGIYNVYSRRNPYFVFFEVNPLTDQPKAQQISLLPIVPSVSFNFKF